MDSIKWYKDGNEFYRIVPNTPIERDRVVIFARPGVTLDRQKSGVSEWSGRSHQHSTNCLVKVCGWVDLNVFMPLSARLNFGRIGVSAEQQLPWKHPF